MQQEIHVKASDGIVIYRTKVSEVVHSAGDTYTQYGESAKHQKQTNKESK